MKRKWFTLLFAFLAVASFRVFAQPPSCPSPTCTPGDTWWMWVDTTGLSLKGVNQLPYSGDKSNWPNWFIFDQGVNPNATRINDGSTAHPRYDGDKALYKVTKVGSNNKIVSITPKLDGSASLKLSYGQKSWETFEVVKFVNPAGTTPIGSPGLSTTTLATTWATTGPFLRTTQALPGNDVKDCNWGYLMPTEGGSADLTDTTRSMLFVVADTFRNLSIKRWDDIFEELLAPSTPAIPAVPALPLYNGAVFFRTFWPNWTTGTSAYMSARIGAINAILPADQAPIDAGTVTGFSREVSYLTPAGQAAYGGVNTDFSDPNYTTKYIGTLNSGFPADLLTNTAYWSNGIPFFWDTNDLTLTPNDAFGLSGVKNPVTGSDVQFLVVIQKQAVGTTIPQLSAPIPAIPAGPLVGSGVFKYKINVRKDANGNDILGSDYKYRPIWIRLEKPAGRWATLADFPGAYTKLGCLKVGVADTKYGGPAIKDVNYDTFSVTKVDEVGGETSGNMIGTGSKNVYSRPQGVSGRIDLFAFTAPQNCNVLSVSLQNDLDIQSQGDGVYANQLELRPYGTYMYYDRILKGQKPVNPNYGYPLQDSVVYRAKAATDGGNWDVIGTGSLGEGKVGTSKELNVATSLQKFAVWIDECGNMTLYPAASYAWKYGDKKYEGANDNVRMQVSTVLPNSVLLYNDPGVYAKLGSIASDKGWGTKIGWWNGNTTDGTSVGWQMTTVPNVFQTTKDYFEFVFKPQDNTPNPQAVAGKWFFLEVQDVKAPKTTADKDLTGDWTRFRTDGIQDKNKTQYVLATEVIPGATTGTYTKHLIVLPKEKVRRYDNIVGDNLLNKWYSDLTAYKAIERANADGSIPQGVILPTYWKDNPYDLVNMAAHWSIEAIPNSTSYKLVNMLGDVVQFNAGSNNIAGGYVLENSQMALYTNNWQTGLGSNNSTVVTNNAWKISTIPGKEDQFVLSSGSYSLKLSDNWTSTANSLYPVYAKTSWINDGNGYRGDSAYWKKDVIIGSTSTTYTTPLTSLPSCDALTFKRVPIYYVPNFSGSFNGERKDPYSAAVDAATINTNDDSFKDGAGSMEKDRLTAFLYLNGTYGIKEALSVGNGLMLGSETVEWNKTDAASFRNGGNMDITFIPIEMTDHNANIRSVVGSGYNGSDVLYGETYKWFIVMKGNKYLVFDTIAPTNPVYQYRTAFTFATTNVANATPVRLYQPLVGDKLQGNFIFEFNVPYYYYETNPHDNSLTGKVFTNNWPDRNINYTGERVFGQLSKQSDFIHAVTSLNEATRFTYAFKPTDNTCCPEQFIDPDWMAQEKLLGMPLKGQLWDLKDGPLAMSFGTSKNEDNKNVSVKEAIATAGISDIKFIFVDSIGAYGYGGNGKLKYQWGNSSQTTTVKGFTADLSVPLYRIQNGAGEYLTVDTTTYQVAGGTGNDVTGVNLVWRGGNPYSWDQDSTKNQAALQLFAISGNKTALTTSDGQTDGWYNACPSYIYLPLASYRVDYKTGKVIYGTNPDGTGNIIYNYGLGKKADKAPCYTTLPVNDITGAFRVGQYSKVNRNQKNLVVQNATQGGNDASYIPLAMKWQKYPYSTLPCNLVLVKDVQGNTTSKPNFYYANLGAQGGIGFDSICSANAYTLLAHWNATANAQDPQLYTFKPEKLITLPGYENAGLNQAQTQLRDQYYFQRVVGTDTFKVYNLGAYFNSKMHTITEDKYVITCIDHKLPYLNLETDAPQNELPAQLAILESKYYDRNLSDVAIKDLVGPTITQKDQNGKILSWQVYTNDKNSFGDATYVKVYKTNVRRLGEQLNADGETGHDIPYYAFSITRGGVEYFLHVRERGSNQVVEDSLYWTALSPDQIEQIQNDYLAGVNQGSKALSRYKFCLPFEIASNGKPKQVTFDGTTYNSVYIQSMDTALTDYPYFVKKGDGSYWATIRRANDLVFTNANACGVKADCLAKNIYSMDYSQVDSVKLTTWIFGGKRPSQTEWVPLNSSLVNGVIVPATTSGYLTDFAVQKGGVTFLDEAAEGINRLIMTGIKNSVALNFEYEGTEQIGSYAKVPIYYYRISIPKSLLPAAAGKEVWLTDSYGKDSKYDYTVSGGVIRKLAYFDATKNVDNLAGTAAGTKYDGTFTQSLALRYVDVSSGSVVVADGTVKDQTFVVVANADYTKGKPAEYRYLQDVENNYFSFVKGDEGLAHAMVFQFGNVKDGDYTGIERVGFAKTIGIEGGVRLLNQTGTVSIYSIDGSLLKTVQVTSADQTVAAPRGIVIVKSGEVATKVVVK